MDKKIEYQIMAHENGWAIVVDEVLMAVHPSRHLALSAAKLLQIDVLSTEEAIRSNAIANLTLTDAAVPRWFHASLQVMVAVPYQVDIPLRQRSGEISFPSSIDGHHRAAGKI